MYITRTILAIGLLYSFASPTITFAALDVPTNGQVIASDGSAFLISGTAVGSAGRWIVYAPNGDYVCEDMIASPWNTYPMTGLKAACGTTATLGSGAYHIFLHDVSYSPGCRVNGSMAYCAATIGATIPICLNVGNPTACASMHPLPSIPAPAPAVAPASFDPIRYGTMNVVNVVVNDNGGTKKIIDFPTFINGMLVISGVTNTLPAPAPVYRVTETGYSNYTRTFSGDCGLNGGFNLNPGDNKFCIVTNDDIGAPIVVAPVPPLIDVVKVPSPLSLPNGPGVVNYTYTLTNIGTVPVTNITLVGDTCSPIIRASGDTNGDQKLDLKEVWVHTCSTTLTETHTNTVVTTGWANGISAVDITSATVVVGVPIVPPLIHVTKIPNPFTLGAEGGVVTYTKIITNPGTIPLSNVRLTDDMCSPVSYVSGDMNTNSLLEPSETWLFSCATKLTQTTINTVVAEGDANGLTAKDIAIATVVVGAPGFPDTGTPSVESSTFLKPILAVTTDLNLGSSGSDVKILQEFLIGEMKGGAAESLLRVGATAYFGAITRSALAEFQSITGIAPALGNFGPITRAYINAHY